MVYQTGMHTMKTPLDHFRHHAMCLALWAALASNIALANEVDDQGRVIAGPLETNLVERGYLFYPLRVLPKTQDTNSVPANVVRTADNSVEDLSLKTAPVSPKVSLPAVPLPQAAETVAIDLLGTLQAACGGDINPCAAVCARYP